MLILRTYCIFDFRTLIKFFDFIFWLFVLATAIKFIKSIQCNFSNTDDIRVVSPGNFV